MTVLRLVLGDQLCESLSALDGLDPSNDIVLMVEVATEIRIVPHHKQKIVLVLSAMRHFAAALREHGVRVDYVALDHPDNAGNFAGEITRAVARYAPDRVIVTEPSEWRVLELMRDLRDRLEVPLEIREDDRFVCSKPQFARWAEGRDSLRMEYFYREMRRFTGFLMEDGEPAQGVWNLDAQNRKPLKKGQKIPARLRFSPDETTKAVIGLVADHFPNHFGDLAGFGWAVTRADALQALAHFVRDCLPWFGDVQDAMKAGEPFLYHSLLSGYINIGLLTPREVCDAAEAAWRAGRAPLNAVEGFIRQIIGWREYVRGFYWLKMPDYPTTNALAATRPLPDFYWSGETDMACIHHVVDQTRRHAYAHHIQRLMVTGNFALLAGLSPAAVEEWYLAVFIDAFDWVELPNTHGMVLFADGGLLASKPYAASGAYIDKMSNYCAGCVYDPAIKLGPGACPFNLLYWHFLDRNRATLSRNPRLAMVWKTLDAMAPSRRAQLLAQADAFLANLH
jgi:deoxyribodipyrimidine photolyase-related protein